MFLDAIDRGHVIFVFVFVSASAFMIESSCLCLCLCPFNRACVLSLCSCWQSHEVEEGWHQSEIMLILSFETR